MGEGMLQLPGAANATNRALSMHQRSEHSSMGLVSSSTFHIR